MLIVRVLFDGLRTGSTWANYMLKSGVKIAKFVSSFQIHKVRLFSFLI